MGWRGLRQEALEFGEQHIATRQEWGPDPISRSEGVGELFSSKVRVEMGHIEILDCDVVSRPGSAAWRWRNPAVPDQLREEALREILGRVDVDGPEIVAVHPVTNETAWLLGLVAVREERLTAQRGVGLVGARGLAPP